MNTPE